jgi:hypothetical protein
MFLFFWVLLRLTLILGPIFGLSLFFVMRAMARQVRKDQEQSRKPRSGGLSNVNWHLAGAAIPIVLILGVRRHQWTAAMTGCAIVFGVVGIAWLDSATERSISRSFLALVDRGPATEDLWLRAAVPVCAVLFVDTFITGEWRFSPGLAVALIWCLSWGFLTRRLRQRAQIQAHY